MNQKITSLSMCKELREFREQENAMLESMEKQGYYLASLRQDRQTGICFYYFVPICKCHKQEANQIPVRAITQKAIFTWESDAQAFGEAKEKLGYEVKHSITKCGEWVVDYTIWR